MTKVLMLWPSLNSALNLNPMLLAHLQYQVEIFFKVIFIDWLLGKVKYHATRVEFHVHRKFTCSLVLVNK